MTLGLFLLNHLLEFYIFSTFTLLGCWITIAFAYEEIEKDMRK